MAKLRIKGEGSVYQRGQDGAWKGYVDLGFGPDGKRLRRYVRGRTQAEALAKLHELRRQLESGVDLTVRSTLREYLDRWLATKAQQVKPRTLELYRAYVDKACASLGKLEVAKVTPVRIQAMVEAIATDAGAATANKVRRVLYGAFKQAVRWRLIAANPVDGVDPVKETPRETTLWTAAEAAKFLDATRPHRHYALFYLFLSTGLRQGEALALRWSDVEADHLVVRRTITRVAGRVEFTTPKTAKGERVVTLSSDVVAVLEAHRVQQAAERAAAAELYTAGELVFCNEVGDVITPMALHHVWGRLKDRAGVPSIRIHDLRHMHVSLLVQRGLDPRTIADRIGHADAAFTLRRYSHVFAANRRSAAVSLVDLLAPRGPVN